MVLASFGLFGASISCDREPGLATGRDRYGSAECFCLRRVFGADDGLGGQQRQRHYGACASDTGSNEIGGVETVKEGRAGGVVDRRREGGMAGVSQVFGGGERGADGTMRR